jgi:hypothetical protein
MQIAINMFLGASIGLIFSFLILASTGGYAMDGGPILRIGTFIGPILIGAGIGYLAGKK